MARQQVVEVQCDRCPRREYRPNEEMKAKGGPDLTLTFLNGEVDITFDDLCSACQKTVKNYIENIKKEPKGKSPERGAKEKPPGKGGSSKSSDDSTEPPAD